MPERPLAALLAGTLFLLLVLTTGPAQAHRLKVFAAAVGDAIEGRVYFVGGGPARGVPVTLSEAAGTVVGTTETDSEEGRFTLPVPYRADFTVTADAGDGHVDRFTLAAARLPVGLPAGPGDGEMVAETPSTAMAGLSAGGEAMDAAVERVVAAAVARQLAPILERLDAMETAVRLRDLLGGIGYVIGVFGLWALWRGRRRGGGGA